MEPPNLNPPLPNKQLMEKASKELFAVLLSNELSEAESVSALTMTLAMRLAYAAKDVLDLEDKMMKFPRIFENYMRINLSNAQSSILQKQADIEGRH